eukprot:COSAG02_NODE_981_length_15488_cov_27.585093_15_plen_115_part_00
MLLSRGGDPIFGPDCPHFHSGRQIAAPQMQRTGGKYRANQLSVLAASTPALFYQMVLERRSQCWRALSDQYLASRIFLHYTYGVHLHYRVSSDSEGIDLQRILEFPIYNWVPYK